MDRPALGPWDLSDSSTFGFRIFPPDACYLFPVLRLYDVESALGNRAVRGWKADENKDRGKVRCDMRAMARLWRWWRALWELDFSATMEVDSHLWDNKSEMRRRLAGQNG